MIPLACIFCSRLLDEETRLAHVWPRSLGGHLASRRTECSECNQFVGTLEDATARNLWPISGSIGAVTADGDPIYCYQDVPGEGRLRTWNGLSEPTKARPPILTIQDGKQVREMPALPRRDEERARVIARGLFDGGFTVEQFEAGIVRLIYQPWVNRTRRVDLGEFSLMLGERTHRRAFTKAAISLLGHVDEQLARSQFLDQPRLFARHDLGVSRLVATSVVRGSGLFSPAELPSMAHSVEVWSTGGTLAAMIRIFGHLHFQGVIATRWPLAPVACAYVVDPRGQARPVLRSERNDGLPLLWDAAPGESLDLAAFTRAYDRRLEQTLSEQVDDPSTLPPDPGVLAPMIRGYMEKLWGKAKGKRRGGRKTPTPE